MIMPDVFTALHRQTIFDLAINGRLPTVCPLRQFTTAGGLVSYGSNFISLMRSQPGVVYCAMVAEDYDNRVMTFRVVYHADAIPEGLINRITNLPGMDIKPRN